MSVLEVRDRKAAMEMEGSGRVSVEVAGKPTVAVALPAAEPMDDSLTDSSQVPLVPPTEVTLKLAKVEASETSVTRGEEGEERKLTVALRAPLGPPSTVQQQVSVSSGAAGAAAPRAGQLAVMPSIQNIVVTINLCCPIDLTRVATSLRNAEYNPRTFPGVIFRILRPRTTSLIFHSGKVVLVGAKTEQDAHLSACILAKLMRRLGFPAQFREFRVRNMVAVVDLKFPVNLEQLSNAHFTFCTYEPEIFSGLVYKLLQPRTTVLVFVSGKIVVVGAKSRTDILRAVENIYPVLRKYRK